MVQSSSNNDSNANVFFFNQYPENLGVELQTADNLGIIPVKVGEPGFDDIQPIPG